MLSYNAVEVQGWKNQQTTMVCLINLSVICLESLLGHNLSCESLEYLILQAKWM